MKREDQKVRAPVVELSDCIKCGICVDLCPGVFRMTDAGYVEVIDLELYPQEAVDEAIKNCPADCILWDE